MRLKLLFAALQDFFSPNYSTFIAIFSHFWRGNSVNASILNRKKLQMATVPTRVWKDDGGQIRRFENEFAVKKRRI